MRSKKSRLPVGKRNLRIELEATSDGTRTATISIDPNWKVHNVIDDICRIPDLRIKQSSIFGLARCTDDDEFLFLRRDEKVSTYAPKSWLNSDLKKNFKVHDPFVLHLKIQHFVATPALQLLDYGTRYYYYLGIRAQITKSKAKIPLEKMFEVIAMGIQPRVYHQVAEYGDNNPTFHQPGVAYFKLGHFVPRWVLDDDQIRMYGGERTVRKIVTTLHTELRGISQFNAQLFFIERARLIAGGNLGHFYRLYANGKAYRGASPCSLLAIGHAGIRLHKFDSTSTISTSSAKLQFEFDWDGIRNFEIQNKKLILRPENQPDCRKMVFHCGHYERARYLLDLITQAHIFDYNQNRMFPPESQKKPINVFHRELSVDEYAPSHHTYDEVPDPNAGFFVDVTEVQIKKSSSAAASRTLSVKAPVRPVRNHIHVDIPRHTSMSAADGPRGHTRRMKYESPYDIVYDEHTVVHAGSNNDSGISVQPPNHFATSLVIR